MGRDLKASAGVCYALQFVGWMRNGSDGQSLAMFTLVSVGSCVVCRATGDVGT